MNNNNEPNEQNVVIQEIRIDLPPAPAPPMELELGPMPQIERNQDHFVGFNTPVVRLSTIYSIRFLNCFMIALILPIFVFLIVVLSLQWGESCSTPLKLWSLVQIIIDGLLILNHFVIILRLPWISAPAHQQIARILSTRSNTAFIRLMHLCWFSWYVVGMVWTFQALADGTCPNSSPFLYWSVFSVLMVHTVVALLSFIFCGFLFIIGVIRTILWRATHRVEYLAPRNRGATTNEITQLTTLERYEAGKLDEESAMCAICLDPYENGQEVRKLPCSELHHFHAACIDQWLISNRNFPLCKKSLEGVLEQ